MSAGAPAAAPQAPQVTASAPIVPVRDVEASVAFYVSVLGFEKIFVASDRSTGEVGLGAARIMFIACDDPATLAVTATNMSVYLQVTNIDGLWRQLQDRLNLLPGRQVRAPFNQEYGMREFHVKDPDGFLMFFGEALA